MQSRLRSPGAQESETAGQELKSLGSKLADVRFFLCLFIAAAALWSQAAAELYPKTGVLIVRIVGVPSSEGTIRGFLYNSKDNWLKEQRAVCSASAAATSGQTVLRFEKVPLQDRYALSVYQDENGNGKMDTGSLIPIPKEPVGASNYEGGSMPRYYECSFFFKASPTELTVKLRRV